LEIRVLAKHGQGVREIARQVGVSRNTVRRYLREPEAGRYRCRVPQRSKLAAFEGYVAARVASALPEQLAASVLLRELRERGYVVLYGQHAHRRAAAGLLRPRPAPLPPDLPRFCPSLRPAAAALPALPTTHQG
jgi:transposase